MKKLFYTIFLLAIVVLSQAQPIDSLKKANDFYAENKIQEAINSYENIINLGYESATLYFNLGNAYFKNNDPINALVNF
jgi:tetratricopeptide (TPR) repeat protein